MSYSPSPIARNKSSKSSIGTGSVSLILIFSVLCLTIFTLLTVSSAKAEHDTAEKTAAAIKAYYAADAHAEEVFSNIRASVRDNGSIPAMVGEIALAVTVNAADNTEQIAYSLPMDSAQVLNVVLRYDRASASVDILKWQIELAAEWSPLDDFNVFVE